ncbi:RCC1 domain-containing protein [Salisediminibacterium selenitireducens]|uniref:Ig domain protein group 2 domain protein n=1 Tax=Bacillus selenitireducens (strain ATCC 700615 / DSM 15326 / MLS10) TaxID=439292 RepID=D6Y078_BACIE|nr:Ig-like domain-containing protein [Salisediminibacterium selenitireducens]ADH98469.1 Ig domain protein group 2 domain protein [[Bacillus] selenitireducens MLS10]
MGIFLRVTGLFLIVFIAVNLYFEMDVKGSFMTKDSVSTSDNHTLILKRDGSVWGFGSSTRGQLGERPPGSTPGRIHQSNGGFLDGAVSVSAGAHHSLVLMKDGTVVSFGANNQEQLGLYSNAASVSNPTVISELTDIIAVSAGSDFSLALDGSGNVWSWGSNAFGKGGHGSVGGTIATPERITDLEEPRIVQVSAGFEHAMALDDEGNVYSWGSGRYGKAGTGQTVENNPNPEVISGIPEIVSVSAGENHSLVLTRNTGAVLGFGRNDYGQIGQSGRNDHVEPVVISGLTDVTVIEAGADLSVAVTESGELYHWGRQTAGTNPQFTVNPEKMDSEHEMASVSARRDLYAVGTNGNVYRWTPGQTDPLTQNQVMQRVGGIDSVRQYPFYPYVQGDEVIFRYVGQAREVQVVGSFNQYNPIELERLEPNGSVWEAVMTLPEGEHFYGFRADNRWKVDMLNHRRTVNRSGDPFNVIEVEEFSHLSPELDGRHVTFHYSSRHDRDRLFEREAQTGRVMVTGSFNNWTEEPLQMSGHHTWTKTVSMDDGQHFYRFVVYDQNGDRREIVDPLNPQFETHAVTGNSRSFFHVTDETQVTVPVESIVIRSGFPEPLRVGEEFPVRVELQPANTTDRSIQWESSNPAVASVTQTGTVRGVSGGSAVIIAEVGGKIAMMTVEVTGSSSDVSFPQAGYENLGDRTNVAPDKEWTIRFNTALNSQTISTDHVYVMNRRGERVRDAIVRPGSRPDELDIVLTRSFTYEAGATYFLMIEEGLQNDFGWNLVEPGMMRFVVRPLN